MTELWRAAFGSYDSMIERGVDTVVHVANLLFRASARFDDVLAIEGSFEPPGRTSAILRLKTEIPDWVRAGLAPFILR